jgi:hypothetical protein
VKGVTAPVRDSVAEVPTGNVEVRNGSFKPATDTGAAF